MHPLSESRAVAESHVAQTRLVVIPCYNERKRLAADAFLQYAHGHKNVQLLFVDDGSTDGTADLLDELAALSDGRITVLKMATNCGKAAAVAAGLRRGIRIGAGVVGYLDADLATPLQEFQRLLEIQEQTGVEAVLGSRVGMAGYDIQRSRVRSLLGRAYASLASQALDMQIHDTQCGAKVFSLSPALEQALETPFATRLAFDVELLARMREADPDVRYLEVPLRRWVEVPGSKVSFPDMVQALGDLARLSRPGTRLSRELRNARRARQRRRPAPKRPSWTQQTPECLPDPR
ncbi:hypothetical protein AYO39_01120 [Actinobacteria bacterium SCGC AG-212-D09]|nr:hypothetical protein AYO39_01120 [Actinobacteria bacterium SCGC AG-212-D09]